MKTIFSYQSILMLMTSVCVTVPLLANKTLAKGKTRVESGFAFNTSRREWTPDGIPLDLKTRLTQLDLKITLAHAITSEWQVAIQMPWRLMKRDGPNSATRYGLGDSHAHIRYNKPQWSLVFGAKFPTGAAYDSDTDAPLILGDGHNHLLLHGVWDIYQGRTITLKIQGGGDFPLPAFSQSRFQSPTVALPRYIIPGIAMTPGIAIETAIQEDLNTEMGLCATWHLPDRRSNGPELPDEEVAYSARFQIDARVGIRYRLYEHSHLFIRYERTLYGENTFHGLPLASQKNGGYSGFSTIF